MITSSEEWGVSKAFHDLATELRDKDHIKAEDTKRLLNLLNIYIACPVKSLSTQNAFFEEFGIVMVIYKDQSNTDREI